MITEAIDGSRMGSLKQTGRVRNPPSAYPSTLHDQLLKLIN